MTSTDPNEEAAGSAASSSNGGGFEFLSESEYDLLVWLEQYYLLNSSLPTSETVTNEGLDAVLWVGCLKKESFINAAVERGIPSRLFSGVNTKGLTEEQLLVVNSLLDLTDNRSRRKKLAEAGISTQKFETWLRDPVFSKYLTERSEALLSSGQHEANLALMDRVRSGELPAIKYFNEMTGRFTPASKNSAVGDSKLLLIRVVEILQIHLSEQPEVLQAVARDLIALSDSGGPEPVLRQPTVRTSVTPKSPVLTPVKGEIVTTATPSIEGSL